MTLTKKERTTDNTLLTNPSEIWGQACWKILRLHNDDWIIVGWDWSWMWLDLTSWQEGMMTWKHEGEMQHGWGTHMDMGQYMDKEGMGWMDMGTVDGVQCWQMRTQGRTAMNNEVRQGMGGQGTGAWTDSMATHALSHSFVHAVLPCVLICHTAPHLLCPCPLQPMPFLVHVLSHVICGPSSCCISPSCFHVIIPSCQEVKSSHIQLQSHPLYIQSSLCSLRIFQHACPQISMDLWGRCYQFSFFLCQSHFGFDWLDSQHFKFGGGVLHSNHCGWYRWIIEIS